MSSLAARSTAAAESPGSTLGTPAVDRDRREGAAGAARGHAGQRVGRRCAVSSDRSVGPARRRSLQGHLGVGRRRRARSRSGASSDRIPEPETATARTTLTPSGRTAERDRVVVDASAEDRSRPRCTDRCPHRAGFRRRGRPRRRSRGCPRPAAAPRDARSSTTAAASRRPSPPGQRLRRAGPGVVEAQCGAHRGPALAAGALEPDFGRVDAGGDGRGCGRCRSGSRTRVDGSLRSTSASRRRRRRGSRRRSIGKLASAVGGRPSRGGSCCRRASCRAVGDPGSVQDPQLDRQQLRGRVRGGAVAAEAAMRRGSPAPRGRRRGRASRPELSGGLPLLAPSGPLALLLSGTATGVGGAGAYSVAPLVGCGDGGRDRLGHRRRLVAGWRGDGVGHGRFRRRFVVDSLSPFHSAASTGSSWRSTTAAFVGCGSMPSGAGTTPVATQAAAPPAVPTQIAATLARAATPAPRAPPDAATWESAESEPRRRRRSRDASPARASWARSSSERESGQRRRQRRRRAAAPPGRRASSPRQWAQARRCSRSAAVSSAPASPSQKAESSGRSSAQRLPSSLRRGSGGSARGPRRGSG